MDLPKTLSTAKLADYTLLNRIYVLLRRTDADTDGCGGKRPQHDCILWHTKNLLLPTGTALLLANNFHWKVYPHRGAELTAQCCLEVFHVTRANQLFAAIRSHCRSCHWLNRRFLKLEIGQMNPRKWSLSPPFYSSMIDILGPLKSYSQYNKRQSTKAWLLFITFCTTSAASVKVLERYDNSCCTSHDLTFLHIWLGQGPSHRSGHPVNQNG